MSLYVVAGTPISHSLSPAMHNAAFSALGMGDHRYGAVQVDVHDAYRIVALMRLGRIAGANITYPLKTAIVPHIGGLQGDAAIIGAANTLVQTEGGIQGLSTDGPGCVHALRDKGVSVKGRSILVIGAGGAARSIALALAHESPKEIVILNRTPRKATRLASLIAPFAQSSGEGLEHVVRRATRADVIIQASAMGMHPYDTALRIPQPSLEHRPAVMDIVYHPLETELLKAAASASCTIVDGIDLLVWQGALSFKEWMGVLPPIGVMQAAARSAMGDSP